MTPPAINIEIVNIAVNTAQNIPSPVDRLAHQTGIRTINGNPERAVTFHLNEVHYLAPPANAADTIGRPQSAAAIGHNST